MGSRGGPPWHPFSRAVEISSQPCGALKYSLKTTDGALWTNGKQGPRVRKQGEGQSRGNIAVPTPPRISSLRQSPAYENAACHGPSLFPGKPCLDSTPSCSRLTRRPGCCSLLPGSDSDTPFLQASLSGTYQMLTSQGCCEQRKGCHCQSQGSEPGLPLPELQPFAADHLSKQLYEDLTCIP